MVEVNQASGAVKTTETDHMEEYKSKEKKQHQIIESLRLDRQLCFPLYAAARKVTALYTPYFKPLGITYTQYLVFMTLQEHDGIRVGDLNHLLYLDNGTLSPLLKKMEKKGWISRTRSKEDERVVMIYLTSNGWNLVHHLEEIPKKVGACLDLAPDKAKQLYDLLYELIDLQTDDSY